jgi:Gpi18-like mannosyltransferase
MRFRFEKLLIFLILTRVFILVLPWLTTVLLFPETPSMNFWQFTASAWNRWDSPHYLYLAQHWYTNIGDPANFIVFFPLYPLILKPAISILINPVVSGILTSTFLFLAAEYFFYKLVKIDYSEKIAHRAVIAAAIFPTSYFFNSPYTESLFFLIFAAALYAARKEKWILTGILTALGVVTRPFGLLLLPAVLTEWLSGKNRKIKFLPVIIFPSLIAIACYFWLNQSIYQNPFEFQKILNLHWQKHLISPLVSITDSWKVALGGALNNFTIMVGWAEAISITVAWTLTPVVIAKLRKSWAVYYLSSLILISSTSFILSTPRYLLSIPPIFILVALAEKNHLFRIVWRFFSIALLICLSILFTRGQWAF